MWRDLCLVLVVFSMVLVLYHHVVYPLLLRGGFIQRLQSTPAATGVSARALICRGYQASALDHALPEVTIFMPVYNEAAVIADKIRNFAVLDYPEDKLRITIYCDGCTDDTLTIIHATLREPECAHLVVCVCESVHNNGKVFAINRMIPTITSEIVMLTDASALVSVDAILLAVSYFTKPRVGVVSGTYCILGSQHSGEAVYWQHQTAAKVDESHINATLGAHGACYFFRTGLFSPLPPDTINDDFILPMTIVANGYQAIYEPNILALEQETTTKTLEARRRARIGAGNLQQLIRLRSLLNPQRGAISFTFASSKALRVLMPFCLVVIWFGSLLLGLTSWGWMSLFIAQCLMYIGVIFWHYHPLTPLNPTLVTAMNTLHYAVTGYFFMLKGMLAYLGGAYRQPWRSSARTALHRYTHVHPLVAGGKRVMDMVAAFFGLIILALLLPFLALLIKLDSPGPVFFKQLRVGRLWPDHTELFMIVKLRTMKTDAEAAGFAVWAQKEDPRITRVGRFLRKTRLDELPQLLNVWRGEMSLIGPRPERPYFFATLEQNIPFYIDRGYGVAPGITGLAQVHLGYGGSIEAARDKLGYDHAYALVLSNPKVWLMTDLSILLQTIKVVILGRGQ